MWSWNSHNFTKCVEPFFSLRQHLLWFPVSALRATYDCHNKTEDACHISFEAGEKGKLDPSLSWVCELRTYIQSGILQICILNGDQAWVTTVLPRIFPVPIRHPKTTLSLFHLLFLNHIWFHIQYVCVYFMCVLIYVILWFKKKQLRSFKVENDKLNCL